VNMNTLDIYYPHQFVQNEENANTKSGIVCSYSLDHFPILANCVTGTIYYDGVALYVFYDKNGKLVFTGIDPPDDRIFPIPSGEIDYANGVIKLTWNEKIPAGKSCLIVSYEYNLECQAPKQVECPKCNHKFFDGPLYSDDFISLQQLADGSGTLDMY
jgi:hypothetical protein